MRALAAVTATLLIAAATAKAQDGVLTEWVQVNPLFEENKIGLGYRVPIPVDTPLPFDGFRSYAGLHMRHQDLAATTPWVHGEEIGTTHAGRSIWAYRLGDGDTETVYGLPEAATLTNGGIHSREWQTPEVVTGILELLATHEQDRHFYDYLRDNVNMIVIPSLNIDGLMQTQRYPSLNYLQTDPRYPDTSPRDGRMRRKNMPNVDEVLDTETDHLGGVDLNRNNNPHWATDLTRSSDDPDTLVYHGTAPASEPETQALDAAAHLGPIGQLRLYTDVHSFSQILYWSRDDNERQARVLQDVLSVFSTHQRNIPGGKWYPFASRSNVEWGGFGMTNEYMYFNYRVPAFGLEVEPSNGQSFHAPLPGCGADYGGVAENCHDGFILPDAEIRRVREALAQTFAAIYYRQAGPPGVQAVRITDQLTGAVVHEAEWDVASEETRVLYENRVQALQMDRAYSLWVAFNKPMRWREEGEIAPFPGQGAGTLNTNIALFAGGNALELDRSGNGWLDLPGGAPDGYMDYEDDALFLNFSIPRNAANEAALGNLAEANLRLGAQDMTAMQLDANPATIVGMANGAWSAYEDSNGNATDGGGMDSTLQIPVTSETLPNPFVLEPGISSSWYDPDHSGEGFVIEMLPGGQVVLYWFTYDGEGKQDWYIAVGKQRGNRIMFPELLRVSGGVFGAEFDPDNVSEEVVGSARFIFTGCDEGAMDWRIGNRRGRQSLARLTQLAGLECGQAPGPADAGAILSGSWYDPTHSGEGFTVEVLDDGRAIVYWFSFGPDGARRWYIGVGEQRDGKLVFDDMFTTRGGIFGNDFDPDTVDELPWGELELDISCAGGTATYSSSEAGFGTGQLNVIKLSSLDGLDCDA